MSRLGGCEGYEVKDDWIERRAGQPRWIARLEPVRGSLRECGGCGERTPAIHDLPWRRVRDLPAFDRRVELRVARVRVACPVRPEARAAAPGNATSRRVGGAAVRGDGGAPRGALLRPGLADRQATQIG